MIGKDDTTKYLPLTETTYYILLTLIEPRHGYAIMQKVEEMSEGTVTLGPGTLYGAFATLEREGLIARDHEEDRRKYYVLTARGQTVLAAHIHRLDVMARNGALALSRLQQTAMVEG